MRRFGRKHLLDRPAQVEAGGVECPAYIRPDPLDAVVCSQRHHIADPFVAARVGDGAEYYGHNHTRGQQAQRQHPVHERPECVAPGGHGMPAPAAPICGVRSDRGPVAWSSPLSS
jgi:hypothetical protein